MANVLYISCDKVITLTGLTGGGSYLNSATVTWVLKLDSDGTTVSGGSGTLSYTAASNGDYTGTIDYAVTALLTAGTAYRIEVTILSGSYNDFRRLKCLAAYRENE